MRLKLGAMKMPSKLRETLASDRADAWRRALTLEHDAAAMEALLGWQRRLAWPARVFAAVGQDILSGQLTLRAMSLVYTTLLSLVPLLAISFSVLKAFGVHNRIEPFLQEMLAPLGERGGEVASQVVNFVDNVQVGVLGIVGFLLLFYTVITLLQKVENAFNYIWHIPGERSISEKFRDYLTAVIIGPVLVFGALGIMATVMASSTVQALMDAPVLGALLAFASRFTTLVMIACAFTFLYTFLPNTRVKLKAAVFGGLAAGLLWTSAGWIFASFIADSGKYTAIYSAFATLIFFMIWLYLVWLIILVGASVAFYAQHPHYIGIRREDVRYAVTLLESTALAAVHRIVRAWYDNQTPPDADRIAADTHAPMPVVEAVLSALAKEGIVERAQDNGGLLPARPPEQIPLKQVLDAVRRDDGHGHPQVRRSASPPPVRAMTERIESAMQSALEGINLRDYALDQSAETGREAAQ